MKKLIIAACLIVAGCTSVPVKRNFPSVPESLTEPAPDLQELTRQNPQLSDLISNATDNYAEYYKLREKYNGWIEWYNTQKEIFDSVK